MFCNHQIKSNSLLNINMGLICSSFYFRSSSTVLSQILGRRTLRNIIFIENKRREEGGIEKPCITQNTSFIDFMHYQNQFGNKKCLHCINSKGKKPGQFLQFRTFRTVTLVSKFWQPTRYFRSGAYNTKCNRAKQFLR